MRKLLCLLALWSGVICADEITIVGTVDVNQPTVGKQQRMLEHSQQTRKLLKIDLTAKARTELQARVNEVQHKEAPSYPLRKNQYAQRLQLGMNGTPVLNQGSHGTCVTFAATAAMDAAMGKGDYLSQLCQLELGQYLENNSYTSSGWRGSWGRIVLNQMDVFGFVPKTYQRQYGCAGLNEYPLGGEDPVAELSVPDYHQISDSMVQNHLAWSSIVEVYQMGSDSVDVDKILLDVKEALTAGDRLICGILLLNFDQGVVGAIGTHHERFDTWILTPEFAQDINEQAEFAGHAMVITGYDDTAVAKDPQGRTYQGLLTLRNSWGENAGDGGNFYMTYDYFKALVLETQRIRHLV